LPVVLTSPVGGLTLSDLGTPMVSSIIGSLTGYVLPGMADIRFPTFDFLGLNAGDVVAIMVFLGALGVASYARDPDVKTIAVISGSVALIVRAVVRVAAALQRASAVAVAPITTAPVKQVEFSTAPPPPPPEPHPIVLATPVSRPATVSQVSVSEDVALLHR